MLCFKLVELHIGQNTSVRVFFKYNFSRMSEDWSYLKMEVPKEEAVTTITAESMEKPAYKENMFTGFKMKGALTGNLLPNPIFFHATPKLVQELCYQLHDRYLERFHMNIEIVPDMSYEGGGIRFKKSGCGDGTEYEGIQFLDLDSQPLELSGILPKDDYLNIKMRCIRLGFASISADPEAFMIKDVWNMFMNKHAKLHFTLDFK